MDQIAMDQIAMDQTVMNQLQTQSKEPPRARPFKTSAELAIARCQQLARISEDPASTRRTFLSPPMREVHREISSWLQALGAKVRIDAAGNLRGLYDAVQSGAPRLLIGSHLDTVPNAGAFDGVLGVLLGVALLATLDGEKLPFAIEMVGFSEEEGVRFGEPFIGSRALVGRLDEALLRRQDANAVTVRRAIEDFGLQPEKIPEAHVPANTLAYLEFHIEQGPVLETLARPLGSVEAIAGQSRLEFIFVGRANHAGTTPMHLRHDAVAAAAEWISAVERLAQSTPGLVATVGKIEAKPGATNVIAGEALLTLDVRHSADEVRVRAVDDLIRKAEETAQRRGLSVRRNILMNQQAVAMDPFLVNQIEEAIRQAGCEPHRMASGGGHDAMILAEKVPAAMIFLRTPGGISHDPAESVAVEDVEKAIECGVHLLRRLASSSEFLKRT
ncbi:MAG: allantoate amidohydrolase [Candidatus Sulfotelmatobacter sp.]|jgi:allantoate deiminase